MTQADITTPQEIEAIVQNIQQEESSSRFLFDLFLADKIDHDIALLTEGPNSQFIMSCNYISKITEVFGKTHKHV